MKNSKNHCELCPRRCRADRTREKGVCHEGEEVFVARAALHFWEEPCISGEEGSGAVFFAGCSLGCVYCQNQEISRGRAGRAVTVEQLAEIFCQLQQEGANNINLVTPTHYIEEIALALRLAKHQGLRLPIVYNTSCYERVEALSLLQGLVDVYLPDFKYWDPETARRYSSAPDYPEVARRALAWMVEEAGPPVFDERGLLQQGVLVRHLVLPEHVGEAECILKYLYETYGNRIYISIMSQYTPMPRGKDSCPELARQLTQEEYEEVVEFAMDLGLEQGFVQEGETAKESFIPAFDGTGLPD